MQIDHAKPVKDIVLGTPASAKVFEQLGIDYCCGGDKPLDEACRTAGVPLETVTQALETAGRAAHTEDGTIDWSGQPLAKLMNHIVEKHHAFCCQEIMRLEPLLDKVVQAHRAAHPELHRIQAVFSGLSKELQFHFVKEEQILFPYISHMEEAATTGVPFSKPSFGAVDNPVQLMVLEHDDAGAALYEIRSLSNKYQLPADACNSYRALFDGLRAFETDMHEHVHLENNVLFPRALAMEVRSVSTDTSARN